jgi:adenylylsulfate kinase
MIALVCGLPGSGKTTYAATLAGIHLNGDAVRADLSADLGFSLTDRIEQARRMGAIARLLDEQGYNVIVDFVCPTRATREAFGRADAVYWMDHPGNRHHMDTWFLWEPPIVGECGASVARITRPEETT